MHKNMSNVTVIIPIHTTENNLTNWLKNSLKSIENQTTKPEAVIIVRTPSEELTKEIESIDLGSIKSITKIIENTTGNYDFSSQVNFGVESVNTEYFSVLEADDEYSRIWFKNVQTYVESYSNVDLFLPLVVETDPSGNFLSFTNEPVWAKDFSEEIGFLDENTIQAYPNFNTSGMVIRTDKFKEFGGYKSSMKLSFIYEFLLRMTHNSCRVMVIPKLGYKHTNNREGSLFKSYKDNVNQDEARFWMNLAKKEYFFTADRNITYAE
jgi:glycosyltransferase involved in cell wall biosynthesis